MGEPKATNVVSDSESLRAQAERHGVATSYRDQAGRVVQVPDETVRVVLEIVTSGGAREGRTPARVRATREQAPLPPGRHWGLTVQLYGVHSANSWGIGDFGDLVGLAEWAGAQGADFVLLNPVHAVAPTLPQEPSPYFPVSRRWVNPIYLRIEALPEYREASAELRARVDQLRPLTRTEFVDRDVVWQAKRNALELLHSHATAGADQVAPGQRDALRDFAVWCALAERYGPDFRAWPAAFRSPDSAEVSGATGRWPTGDRVRFYEWLQNACERQLQVAHEAALQAGMRIGLVHDLAVGVNPGGADAWALADALVSEVTIGAPPDDFNQRGQDWQLPPWHPKNLAEADYQPFREMLRAAFTRGGGLRIDHILGLFRLWWIPGGCSPAEGTFVRYDSDALLSVLVEEARRADAVVIGEDLGTVEPAVARTLAAYGLPGCQVLWFARAVNDDTGAQSGPLLVAEEWRELALASITTHDLPTAAGFLQGEHVRVRAELGQLTRSESEEWGTFRRDRAELLDLLVGEGVLDGADSPVEEVVVAMHRHLARTPSRLVAITLEDLVGEVRQPNLPGTVDEYPNWRHRLALSLEDLPAAPLAARLVAVLTEAMAGGGRPTARGVR